MARLPQTLLSLPTLRVARNLLGTELLTQVEGVITSGMITEVEAYHQDGDPASHSFRGITKRNEPMFKNAGHCYVYLIYGVHYCVNVVTEKEGVGAAVLIRAVEPLKGTTLMEKRRNVKGVKNYTSGPAKLCQALGIDLQLTGEHFRTSKQISLNKYHGFTDKEVGSSPRIGISKAKELPWRFYVKNSEYLSR